MWTGAFWTKAFWTGSYWTPTQTFAFSDVPTLTGSVHLVSKRTAYVFVGRSETGQVRVVEKTRREVSL